MGKLVKLTELGRLFHASMTLLAKKFILTVQSLRGLYSLYKSRSDCTVRMNFFGVVLHAMSFLIHYRLLFDWLYTYTLSCYDTLLSVYLLVSVIFDFMLLCFCVAVIVWFRPSCISSVFVFFYFLYFRFYIFLSAVLWQPVQWVSRDREINTML